MENILYDLTFCDPLGINISTNPEALHAILLGHGTHLLNAFARLEKEQKQKKKKKDVEEEEELDTDEEDEEKPTEKKKRKNFVFTGDFGKLVATEMEKKTLVLSVISSSSASASRLRPTTCNNLFLWWPK